MIRNFFNKLSIWLIATGITGSACYGVYTIGTYSLILASCVGLFALGVFIGAIAYKKDDPIYKEFMQ